MTRIVYSDLDGTMVGPRGCFFRTEARTWSIEPAQALVALHEAGLTLVLVSGRTKAQLVEAAAFFGADGFIAEMGALVCWDGGRSADILAGTAPPPLVRAPDAIVSGLLERFAGRLDIYDPWHEGHEVDVLMRGNLDGDQLAEAEGWLAAEGFGWLRLRDNGVLPSAVTGARLAPDIGAVHVFHLMPDGITKGLAVSHDLARRGLSKADAIAIGDSAGDLEMAEAVGQLFLVANGARQPHMPPLLAEARRRNGDSNSNVTVTEEGCGLGWVQAIQTALR